MSKYKELFDWLVQCPQLKEAWFLKAEAKDYASVIVPAGTANPTVDIDVTDYVGGGFKIDFMPNNRYYEDYQINAYMETVSQDNGFNMTRLEDAQSICDWLIEQRNTGNLPDITGTDVYNLDVVTPNPFIRGIDQETGLIGYFITMRIYVRNPHKRIIKTVNSHV